MSRAGRILGSVPFLVSVAVHAVIVGAAAVYVVQETREGRKKAFEAAAAAPPSAPREVEHRLQVARRGGGSVSASPVSTHPILSASAQALALPALPDLPPSGASLFGGGFGGTGAGPGLGSSGGLATGLGNAGLGGRGFVSLTFLGMTNPRVSRVAFVVDVSRGLMDIRKGGFKAFGIIRGEIMKLVGQLPPGAEFGVVLYGGSAGDLNLFRPALSPATVANKEAFFAWMTPVNADPDKLGTRSAGGYHAWQERPMPAAGLDVSLMPPPWLRALRAALEMKPEIVYVIAGGASTALKKRSDERMGSLERRNEQEKERLRRAGIDPEGVAPARNAALARARRQLNAINERLKAQGRSPLIVTDTRRVFMPDFQAELKRLGFSIELDTTGWADPQGKPIWEMGVSENERVDFTEVLTYVSRLQNALLRERAIINTFLFVGPDEKPRDPLDNLTSLARRNGGKCDVLTAKKLEDLSSK